MNSKTMQTILGSVGAIGVELAKSLREYTSEIRLVSRNPQKVNDTDELMPADFYGPGIKNSSMLNETIIKPLSIGGKANILGSDKFLHTYTYTPDAAKATAILGNTDDAFNQVWHLPTAKNSLTGKQMAQLIAAELGVKPRHQNVSKFMVRIIGLFVPIMKEIVEMMYQYDRNYVFDSSKFEKRFSFKPTPYNVGIKDVILADYKSKATI